MQVLSPTLTEGEGVNFVLGTVTGTKVGAVATQKLGFFGVTPVVQPAGATDVLASLVTLGLRAASANPPLNLGTGTLTAGYINLPAGGAITASRYSGIGATSGYDWNWFSGTPGSYDGYLRVYRADKTITTPLLSSSDGLSLVGGGPILAQGGSITAVSIGAVGPGSASGITFQNSEAGSNLYRSGTGVLTTDGALVASGGLNSGSTIHSAGGQLRLGSASPAVYFDRNNVNEWLLYQASNSSLYIRDCQNARMVLAFTPGTAGAGYTQSSGKFIAASEAIGQAPLIAKGFLGQTADLQQWQDSTGAVKSRITAAGKFVGPGSVSKYAATVGDGTNTAYTVTHALATTDIAVSVWEVGAKRLTVVNTTIVDANTVTINFASPPATGAYRVVVTG